MTPVHARAGQLVLIRRWIAMQVDLLNRLAAHLRIARILKGRIITDLVSFCDCLVTRPLSPGAPQAMDGLDKLITANGQSSAPIDNFIAASNFQAELQTARAIRDTVGPISKSTMPIQSRLSLRTSTPTISAKDSAFMSVSAPPSPRLATASSFCGCIPPMAGACTA
jgi:hypothetical protein